MGRRMGESEKKSERRVQKKVEKRITRRMNARRKKKVTNSETATFSLTPFLASLLPDGNAEQSIHK